jgi:hypothetical protein
MENCPICLEFHQILKILKKDEVSEGDCGEVARVSSDAENMRKSDEDEEIDQLDHLLNT